MNTRFKALSTFVIFVLSLTVLLVFFSNDGLIAAFSREKQLDSVEGEIRRREGYLAVLRYMADGDRAEDTREKDLVHSFSSDDVYDPSARSQNSGNADFAYGGLSNGMCLLISLLVAFLYAVIIMVVIPFTRKTGGAANVRDHRMQKRKH